MVCVCYYYYAYINLSIHIMVNIKSDRDGAQRDVRATINPVYTSHVQKTGKNTHHIIVIISNDANAFRSMAAFSLSLSLV